MTDELIERIASATFEIPREDQWRLIDACKRRCDTGISLDRALGLGSREPDGARARRDYFLRRAFAHFHVPADRRNTSPARTFAERIARFARREYHAVQRAGHLPDDALAACLYLALEADPNAAQLSAKQLGRILDI